MCLNRTAKYPGNNATDFLSVADSLRSFAETPGVPVVYGFLARGFGIDDFEGQGYFDEFFSCIPLLISSLQSHLEQISLSIVNKVYVRIFCQSPDDAGTIAAIRQHMVCERRQRWISRVGVPGFDVFNCQIVWQVSGADNFHAVSRDCSRY
jgi:hypothetical protein